MAKNCQRCNSDKLQQITVQIEGIIEESGFIDIGDLVPDDNCYVLVVVVCFDCGQIQGKFPIILNEN